MIQFINISANIVVFVFCVWAVLDRRVHTKALGTTLFSIAGVAAAVNIARPIWFIPDHYEAMFNVALAGLAVWGRVHWKDPRKTKR